jgi:hypothetical protein
LPYNWIVSAFFIPPTNLVFVAIAGFLLAQRWRSAGL